MIALRHHTAGLLLLLAASSVFMWRVWRGTPFKYPLGAGVAPVVRYGALALGVIGGGILLTRPTVWTVGYASLAGVALLLMMLAASFGRPAMTEGADNAAPARLVAVTVVVAGGAVLVGRSMELATGYFATSTYLLLLLGLAASAEAEEGRPLAELAALAAVLGTVYAVSSGTGLHNFGVGAASVIPFLVLYAARRIEGLRTGCMPAIVRHGALPLLVVLLLLNGMRHPYREERGVTGFMLVHGVPAFAGLRTSPDKIEAIDRFNQLFALGALKGKRVLVIGPQPWFYFASQSQPTTPMFFMHFSGGAEVDQFVAQHLFRGGEPDAILVTAPVPPPIYARIARWVEQGCTAQVIKLPPELRFFYGHQTGYALPSEIVLLRREPTKP